MEHCLFLMNLEVWNIVYSNEPRGMEHCLFPLNLDVMNLEVWNIVYF